MKENQQVEWKSSWRDDYLRWICGFDNAEGGTLVEAVGTIPEKPRSSRQQYRLTAKGEVLRGKLLKEKGA